MFSGRPGGWHVVKSGNHQAAGPVVLASTGPLRLKKLWAAENSSPKSPSGVPAGLPTSGGGDYNLL